MQALKTFYDWMYKITMFICKLLLVADILVVSFTVLGRYVSFIPDPTWTEEITLTLMSYMAVLSGALAIRRGAHIRMTAFDKYLPHKMLLVLDLLADIAVLILGVILVVQGCKVVSPTGNIAKFAKYSSIPTLS